MLNTQLCRINASKSPLLLASPFLSGTAGAESARAPIRATSSCAGKRTGHMRRKMAVRAESAEVAPAPAAAAAEAPESRRPFFVRAEVTVQKSYTGLSAKAENGRSVNDADLGERLLLVLVSTFEFDKTPQAYAQKIREEGDITTYVADFPPVLMRGALGAVLVENEHHKEMYLRGIRLAGFPGGEVDITCNSWVHSKSDNPNPRIFFTNKTYLPSETPAGLRKLRELELLQLRGNGRGERQSFERIYDYDTYNDLGDPDKDPALKRPVLGGKEHPYPRRCRTGRPRTITDPLSEMRVDENYVPRDEKFSDVKQKSFSGNVVYSVLNALLPTLDPDLTAPFPYFTAIDSLYDERVKIPNAQPRQLTPNAQPSQLTLKDVLPDLFKVINHSEDPTTLLRFDTPAIFFSDRFGWLKDEELGRQTLAGLNPCSIQLVTEWPLKSNLDPKIYGPPDSAITTELVERQMGGFITVEEAIKQKKLFIIDYHDALLPYVNKVRELGKGTTMYGSRTLFCLMPDETLKPIAIELTRPPSDGEPQWKEVYTPTGESTAGWLWTFAKAHAVANDSAYHQLISHWLRTHACSEPYVIATHRQLSVMHPIHRLLRPHLRYTLEINAIGRVTLISAGGTTETSFNAGKYAMEISSEIYKNWRFDKESLPAELIKRGMATEDSSAPNGIRLTIQDYPYASDGLLIWDCIKEWVTEYVNHYYPSPDAVRSDTELQAWWTEIRTRGHEDKKDEPWWPELKTVNDLIGILSTMIWMASAHHAAVNYGQYAYAGYFPNRPTIARTKMPSEDPTDEEWNLFVKQPEAALLQSFPSQIQATRVMAVMYVLSTHSPDEEYIGDKPEPAWVENPVINAAYKRFSGRLKEIEAMVEERNGDSSLKNRCGAGVVPYELLKPFSELGVTSKGVPNSISI